MKFLPIKNWRWLINLPLAIQLQSQQKSTSEITKVCFSEWNKTLHFLLIRQLNTQYTHSVFDVEKKKFINNKANLLCSFLKNISSLKTQNDSFNASDDNKYTRLWSYNETFLDSVSHSDAPRWIWKFQRSISASALIRQKLLRAQAGKLSFIENWKDAECATMQRVLARTIPNIFRKCKIHTLCFSSNIPFSLDATCLYIIYRFNVKTTRIAFFSLFEWSINKIGI